MILTLDDAVKVAKRLVVDDVNDDEIIRQELEQKCWIPPKTNKAERRLHNLILDVNPTEICEHIAKEDLRNWCAVVQVEMITALMKLSLQGDGNDRTLD